MNGDKGSFNGCRSCRHSGPHYTFLKPLPKTITTRFNCFYWLQHRKKGYVTHDWHVLGISCRGSPTGECFRKSKKKWRFHIFWLRFEAWEPDNTCSSVKIFNKIHVSNLLNCMLIHNQQVLHLYCGTPLKSSSEVGNIPQHKIYNLRVFSQQSSKGESSSILNVIIKDESFSRPFCGELGQAGQVYCLTENLAVWWATEQQHAKTTKLGRSWSEQTHVQRCLSGKN